MAHDTNLYLEGSASAGTAVTANGNTTAINVDGGDFAVVHLFSSVTPTDADETLDIIVQASVDGTNYGNIGRFPQLIKGANKGSNPTRVGIPVYIPRYENQPAGRGSLTSVKLRLNYTVGGTTPSFTLRVWAEPVSNVPHGSVAGYTSGNPATYGPLDAIAAWCT